jgi:uncharacterized protein YdaU (DUF1376 family)
MGKSKAPAVQFYVSDFLTGTTLMTNEEVGLYIRLLCLQVENGSVPDDPDRMAQVYGPNVPKIWTAVRKKFIKAAEDGMMVNEKMASVLIDRANYRLRQSEKGKLSADARLNRGKNKKKPRFNHGSTTGEPIEGEGEGRVKSKKVELKDEAFEKFWIAYERKGNRKSAEQEWQKISHEDHAAIMANVPKYNASKPDMQFRRDGERYLKHRVWEDAIVIPTNKTTTNGQRTDEERRAERHRIIAERYGVSPTDLS